MVADPGDPPGDVPLHVHRDHPVLGAVPDMDGALAAGEGVREALRLEPPVAGEGHHVAVEGLVLPLLRRRRALRESPLDREGGKEESEVAV